MPPLPGITTTTDTDRRILIDDQGLKHAPSGVLDSSNTDSGSSPATRFRRGNVVILRTSTGRYVEANDANADSPAPASVSASETADTDWQSAVISITVDGGVTFTVTLAATDDTDAEVVTALNANAVFAANCIADVNGGVVRIRTLEAGDDKHLLVSADLTTAFGASGTSDSGTDPDVRVVNENVDLIDEDGAAAHAEAAMLFAGHFDESNLINLTAEARAVLAKRGSIFG